MKLLITRQFSRYASVDLRVIIMIMIIIIRFPASLPHQHYELDEINYTIFDVCE